MVVGLEKALRLAQAVVRLELRAAGIEKPQNACSAVDGVRGARCRALQAIAEVVCVCVCVCVWRACSSCACGKVDKLWQYRASSADMRQPHLGPVVIHWLVSDGRTDRLLGPLRFVLGCAWHPACRTTPQTALKPSV